MNDSTLRTKLDAMMNAFEDHLEHPGCRLGTL